MERNVIKNKQFINSGLLITLLMFSYLMFENAIASAIHIWTISEIFNHCFLVLPVSIYLIYIKRAELYNTEITPFYPAFFLLLIILCIQVFAEIGDITVISHLALFTYIPITIVAFLGLRASKLIAFPLCFMLLAVPIGEELIPYLQSITADMSVAMVKAVGIPVYRSGLYIDIPAGKFLVAEACSGISFLISSIAFGSLYAHLNFETLRAKVGFILLSIIVPIIANSVRVFGIISIAHVSEMKYAVGADHLVYGWFFYLLVLALLFSLGEYLSRNSKIEPARNLGTSHTSWSQYNLMFPSSMLIITLIAFLTWQTHVRQPTNIDFNHEQPINLEHQVEEDSIIGSLFIKSEKIININRILDGTSYHLSIGYYPSYSNNEAISSLNELFDKKNWSLAGQYTSVSFNNSPSIQVNKLVSVRGINVAVANLYVVNEQLFASSTKAKLYETYLKVINLHRHTLNLVISSSNFELENVEQLNSEIPLLLQPILKWSAK